MADRAIVEPEWLWIPDHVSSAGDEAIDLGRSVGLHLYPEQELAVRAILSERADGKWASLEAAIIAGRQNLKTFVFKVIALADMYLFDNELDMWTAHELATSMESFRDIQEIIESDRSLLRRRKGYLQNNNGVQIEFYGGRRLVFRARTAKGGRGLTGDRLFLDEGFDVTPAMVGSLMPLMSARSVEGNPQILWGSSAGHSRSGPLRELRDRGRAGGDPSLTYIEWADPDAWERCATPECDHDPKTAAGCALDDIERIRKANPLLEERISIDFVRGERRAMIPLEFARERLGWWEEPIEGVHAIPMEKWQACADVRSNPTGVPVVAVDVSPNRKSASIAAAALRPDGRVHVEVVETGPGTAWVITKLAGLATKPSRIVADASSPAASLIIEAAQSGVTIDPVTTQEHARACGLFYDLVIGDRLAHLDDPVLQSALEGASQRDSGDGAWLWSRKNSKIDISPLVAATLAVGSIEFEGEDEGVGTFAEVI